MLKSVDGILKMSPEATVLDVANGDHAKNTPLLSKMPMCVTVPQLAVAAVNVTSALFVTTPPEAAPKVTAFLA